MVGIEAISTPSGNAGGPAIRRSGQRPKNAVRRMSWMCVHLWIGVTVPAALWSLNVSTPTPSEIAIAASVLAFDITGLFFMYVRPHPVVVAARPDIDWATAFETPKVWAAAYLCAVPFFAVLFMAQSDGFRQSTLSDDALLGSTISQDASKVVSNIIGGSLKEEYSGLDPEFQLTADGNVIRLSGQLLTVMVIKPDAENVILSARAEGPFEGTLERPPLCGERCSGEYYIRVTGSVDLGGYLAPFECPGSGSDCFSPVPESRAWPATDAGAGGILLAASPSQASRIDAMFEAVSGDPRAARLPFPRFVYLSAVTLTTLGYGDIVPVRGTARLLVSIEAMSGLVIGGLGTAARGGDI